MAVITAITGPGGTGKTLITTQLALETYRLMCGMKRIAVIYADNDSPGLPVVFPNIRPEMNSIGEAVSKSRILPEDLLGTCITDKKHENMGFWGYADGENVYTYPAVTDAKAMELFEVLEQLVDFIFVDCVSRSDCTISRCAEKNADLVYEIYNPDIKSLVWYYAHTGKNGLMKNDEARIKCLNITDAGVFLPVDEVASKLKNVSYFLPFDEALKSEMLSGRLINGKCGKRFGGIINEMAVRVTGNRNRAAV